MKTWRMSILGLIPIIIFFVRTEKVFATHRAPDLKIVQPLYSDYAPLKMYLDWESPSFPIEAIRFHRKADGGNYGAWCIFRPNDAAKNNPCCELAPESWGFSQSCVDKSPLHPGIRYSYEMQVKIFDEWSYTSNARSNRAAKVWPVTDGATVNNECTGDETIGIVNGFNQIIRPTGVAPYPHEGIDLRGKKTLPSGGECVRSPVG